MKKALFTYCMIMSLVGMLILTACVSTSKVDQSMVMPIGAVATLKGIQSVINEVPGSFIMQGKNLVMLAWPEETSYGFAVFSCQGKPILDILDEMGWTSQKIGMMSMVNLFDWLTERGWNQVPIEFLPGVLLASMKAYTITAIMAGSQILPDILVIPAGTFQLPPQA